MSSVERRLAQDILNSFFPDQAKQTEPAEPVEPAETANPGLVLQLIALKRYMTDDKPDAQTEIAIKALVQSILPYNFNTAFRLQSLDDINAQFDRLNQSIEAKTGGPINTEVISQRARQSQPLIDYLRAGPVD